MSSSTLGAAGNSNNISAGAEIVYEAVSRVHGSLPQSVDEFAHLNLRDDDDDDSNDKNNSSSNNNRSTTNNNGGASDAQSRTAPNDNNNNSSIRYFLDANARSAFASAIAQRMPIVGEVVCVGDATLGALAPPSLAKMLGPQDLFALVIVAAVN